MYVIPILVLAFVIAIGAVWSPIFALVIAVPLFVLFLAYVGFSGERMRRRAGQVERQYRARAGRASARGDLGRERRLTEARAASLD